MFLPSHMVMRLCPPLSRHQGGDEYHVVHVIPRLQLSSQYGAPSIDFLPQQVCKPVGMDGVFFLFRQGSRIAPAHGHRPTPTQSPQDSTAYEALLQRAQDFLAARVVTHLGDVDPPPMLHLIKVAGCSVSVRSRVGAATRSLV